MKPRKHSGLKRTADWLSDQQSPLATLVTRCRPYEALFAVLRETLPEEFHGRCRLGGLRGSRLLLFTDSAGIATRLRMQCPKLTTSIAAAADLPIESIEVRVDPAFPKTANSPKHRRMSKAVAAMLAQQAKYLDGGLAEALASLSGQNPNR